eukprot:NODE_5781_length_677_cov_4.772293_g4890_i0.p2 GENE.NODE_5781_length_677_cov_4.772293_g4890_i0~~NODE_5781_length_677_cov_4.772293_g4890_i0.p2  ORF type:complete len:110 (-),score=6.75 NODE_5781_length_677_cov_4.772293_g4890_i0:281-610(-)
MALGEPLAEGPASSTPGPAGPAPAGPPGALLLEGPGVEGRRTSFFHRKNWSCDPLPQGPPEHPVLECPGEASPDEAMKSESSPLQTPYPRALQEASSWRALGVPLQKGT